MDKEFFERETQKSNPYSMLSNKVETKAPASREIFPSYEPNGFLPLFFVELLDRFKNTLDAMKTFTRLSREKMNETEVRDYYYRVMNEDIQEIESAINSLLSYVKINTPIIKSNTVHNVLDKILKKNESQLNSRKIKVIKKYEKELPETIVHETQLRYIFNSILEYAIPFTLPNGSIGFLTKVTDIPKDGEEGRTLLHREGRYIEIVVVFTGYKKQEESADVPAGTQTPPKEEKTDLKLLLVKEIVRKNSGMMTIDVNEKKPRTQISLFFPLERRRVVDYSSLNP